MNKNKLYVIEKDGRKREAQKYICIGCGKEFLGRKTTKRKFCSRQCKCDLSKKTRIKLVCCSCNKIFYKPISRLKNSKHKKYFCSRKCKDTAQRLNGSCTAIQPDHYGTGDGAELYRNLLKNTKNPKCSDCGDKRRYVLLVHHKDGKRKNNSRENLEIVCGTCHFKRHLKQIKNTWVYDSRALTPRKFLKTL